MKIRLTQPKPLRMRNLYFLLLFSFFGTFTSLAQKIDYDHSSKWFLGFNVGATWSTTDVKSTTSSGWGVILGKSFNYNYGSVLSFDLRGRYLRGNWYGQDKDTTSLANYTGTALNGYKTGQGFTVNNFQADVHRLALELAIHLNSVREKTGFDPYIFGGVGLTFKQTYGDLYYKGDSTYLYDYSSMLSNGPLSPQLSSNMDGIYDTPLDGSSNKYKAYFMPSLGIGLGYQLGKRVSIGIEHKTTFTMKDDFDGYLSSSPRAKNDWYHYTSAYIQFRFKTRGDGTTNSDGTNSSGNLNNFNGNCVSPKITINSTVNNTVVYAVYRLSLTITEVAGSNKIQLLDANNQPVLFNYDMTSKQLIADINLKQGANTFTVKAENDCGKDTKTFTVTYAPCLAPTANFTNPASPNTTVKNSNFTINAMLGNVTPGAKVDITLNNNIVQGFNYNPATGILMSSLNLQPGINTITLGVSTECGNVNISTTVNYDNCQNPVVQLVSPSATGTTSSSSALTIIANVKNVNNANELRLFQNNTEYRNFTFVNGQLQFIANLTRGTNTFVITATTSCGTMSQSFDVNYQDCTAPKVTITAPANNATITSATVALKAKVENVTAKQNISLKLNGIEVSNFTFNTNTKATESTIALQQGMNVITVSATNNCGSDIETVYLNYDNCQTPVISVNNVPSTVNAAGFLLTAQIQNMPDAQGLQLSQNGAPINYNYVNGTLTSTVNLVPGNNTFTISASRTCGNAIKNITIFYNDCVAPTVNIQNPSTSGTSTNVAAFVFKAIVTNVSAASGITVSKNGANIPFVLNAGIIEATTTLAEGSNVFKVNVANGCGTDSKTSTITYVNCLPPVVNLINPITANATVNTSQINLKASILNAGNNGISVKLNGTTVNYSFSNGVLNAGLTLVPGTNTILLSANNNCGSDIETITIFYDNCVAPQIQFNTLNNLILSSGTLNISATISGTLTSQNIALTVNGQNKGFTWLNGALSASLTLTEGVNTIVLSASNSCGSAVGNLTETVVTCVPPVVTLTTPLTSGTTVNSAAYTFSAAVQNAVAQGITLKLNGTPVAATYNNGMVQANVTLQNGLNTFVLTATNACGNDAETVSINYSPCLPPVVTLTTPSTSGTTVNTAAFAFSAAVQNAVAQGITLKLNGTAVAATYNNGMVQANVTLQNGLNTFVLTATNACGNDAETVTVNYSNCVPPVVTLTTPSTNGTTVNSATYAFSATVQNAEAQGITLKLNGNVVAATYNNGVVQANVTLQNGLNTFVLTATNTCGNDAETVTINYTPCLPPVVTLATPSTSGTTVNTATFTFSAAVQNAEAQGITLKLNGTAVAATYNNGAVQANVTLQNGLNTFVLTATSACGNDAETVTINYNDCVPPVVTFQNPMENNTTVTRPAFNLSARVTNVNGLQGIAVTLNGVSVEGFSFINGVVQANLNLLPGTNTITVSGTNACGNDNEVITINYNSCVPPRVGFTQPATTGLSVNAAAYTWKVTVQNITNAQAAQGIVVLFNNVPTNNFMFDNGQLTFSSNLVSGLNTLKVTATNACGTVTETSSINYISCVPPTVSIDPPYSRSPSNSTYFLSASVTNVTSSQNISVTQNGQSVNNFTFTNNKVQATLNMQNGPNLIRVTAVNDCGTAYHDTTITYGNCTPTIQFNNSLASGSVTTAQSLNMGVSVGNYDSNTQISVTINGNAVNGYTNNNGQLSGTINLPEGLTTIVVSATNSCGSSTEEFQITRCKPATFGLISPAQNNAVVSTQTILLGFNVFNTDNTSSITVTQGGQPVNGFSMNGTEVSGYVNLNPGLNTFNVAVTTICNQFTENINITYNPSTGNDGPPDRGGNGTTPNRDDDTLRNNTNRNQNVVRPGGNFQNPTNPTNGGNNGNSNSGGSNNNNGGNSNNNNGGGHINHPVQNNGTSPSRNDSNNGGSSTNNNNNSGGHINHPTQNNSTSTPRNDSNSGGSTPKPASGNNQPRTNTTPTPPSISKPNVTPQNTGTGGGQNKTNTNKGAETPKPDVKSKTIGKGGGGN